MKWPVATGTSYELSSSVSGGSGVPPVPPEPPEPPLPVVPAPPPVKLPAPLPKLPPLPVGLPPEGLSELAPAHAERRSSSETAAKRFVTDETFEQPTCHRFEVTRGARVSRTCDRSCARAQLRSATFVSRNVGAYTPGRSGAIR